ncbi:amidohydrolase [Bifidobacterium goeldii]|uniref:Amidohydrolase n=1 Tax=Bifidobacterium goeldii TaxID=2306975 RepID=A0A430FNE7_9BIFI|nr:amidohydrolase family protein [Bifidobacterium goeldii]RSX54363.1 amidohydrolase [Bifidobacterium goeldii]
MSIAINNGTVLTFDAGTVLAKGSVLIENGVITYVGTQEQKADTVIDAAGKTVLPGLINLHDHVDRKSLRVYSRSIPFKEQSDKLMEQSPIYLAFHAAKNLYDELCSGVTTIRDFGLFGSVSLHAKRALADKVIVGPKLLTSGEPIAMTGGHATKWGSIEADGVDAVVRAVRHNITSGADVIKMMASGGLGKYPEEDPGTPELTEEELAAGVVTAHALKKKVAAHVYSTEAIDNCINARIDTIEHGAFLTKRQAVRMRELGLAHVPTISGLAPIAYQRILIGQEELGNQILHDIIDRISESIRISAQNGVLLGAGTDTNGEMVEELEMIRDATDWPLEKVIATATVNAARISDVNAGQLKTGLRGDVLIVDGNPLEDLNALRSPYKVITPTAVVDGRPMPRGVRRAMLEGDA